MGGAATRFDDLYTKRRGAYVKDASGEEFLEALNEYLEPRERALYGEYDVEYPFVFVIGLPRSGRRSSASSSPTASTPATSTTSSPAFGARPFTAFGSRG